MNVFRVKERFDEDYNRENKTKDDFKTLKVLTKQKEEESVDFSDRIAA